MRAQITYHKGKSCWVGHHRFKLDMPLTVTDPQVVAYCKSTAGFTVDVQEEDQPKKVVRKVISPSLDDEEAAPRTTKKKTSKRR